MWPKHQPQRGTTEAANIRDNLRKKLYTLYEGNHDDELYVPHNLLSEWVTKDAVGKWIEKSEAKAYAPIKLRDKIHETALRTFCILIEIEREDAIGLFLGKARPELQLDMAILALDNDKDSVQRFLQDFPEGLNAWPKHKCQQFCDQKRRYFATTLKYGETRYLDDNDILPFRKIMGEPMIRDKAKLYKVLFDAQYLLKAPHRLKNQKEVRDYTKSRRRIRLTPSDPNDDQGTSSEHCCK